MSDSDNSSVGGGCNCVGLVLFILMVTAIGWGLPMPGGKKINIDIFPPRIWDMNEGRSMEAVPAPQPEKE